MDNPTPQPDPGAAPDSCNQGDACPCDTEIWHTQWSIAVHQHRTAGQLILIRHYNDSTSEIWLSVDQADPHIMIADELLHLLHADPLPIAYLDHIPEQTREQTRGNPTRDYRGALFHIKATDQHLVYRIGEYEPSLNTWSASWPD